MKPRKQIPFALKIAIVAVVVLVLGLAGWFMFVRPQSSKLKSIKAEAATAQQQLADHEQEVAAARSAPRIDVADVYRLATAMPDKTDMPDLMLQLGQLARDTGITFDSITPQPTVTLGSYSVLPISVTFNGTFYNLADFLYRVRSLVSVHAGVLDATGRLFEVDTLAFAESPLKFPNIQATLTVDAFVYGTGGGAASGAPTAPVAAPTTPATTTTTATITTGTTTTTDTTTTTPTTPTSPGSASAAGAP